MSLAKYPVLNQSVERVQQARAALARVAGTSPTHATRMLAKQPRALAAFACLSMASGLSSYNTKTSLKMYFHEDFHIFRLQRFIW